LTRSSSAWYAEGVRVELSYFRAATGRFCGAGEYTSHAATMTALWEEVAQKRALGMLPGLRPREGHQYFILVTVEGHTPHLVVPTRVDEDDVTPVVPL
jgi:hypothetical protein